MLLLQSLSSISKSLLSINCQLLGQFIKKNGDRQPKIRSIQSLIAHLDLVLTAWYIDQNLGVTRNTTARMKIEAEISIRPNSPE